MRGDQGPRKANGGLGRGAEGLGDSEGIGPGQGVVVAGVDLIVVRAREAPCVDLGSSSSAGRVEWQGLRAQR